jgi:hypothetical protein
MSEEASTCVRTPNINTKDILIIVGVHQGSTLNLHFFELVLDMLTKHSLELVLLCMLCLVGEFKEGIDETLEIW